MVSPKLTAWSHTEIVTVRPCTAHRHVGRAERTRLMNWEEIGVIAQVVAAFAVMCTLWFLAAQIRQNSKSIKASAAQSVIQSLATAYSTTAMSPELCHIIVVGAKDMAKLTEHETAQLYMWLTSWYRLVEQAYLHFKMGNLPATT